MSLTQEDREDRIRRRAYKLWQDAGMRNGDDVRFWMEAIELEEQAEAKGEPSPSENFPAE